MNRRLAKFDGRSDYAELAEKAAGNYENFDSFVLHDSLDSAGNWCIVYTHNRDSGPLDKANAQVIAAELAAYDDDVRSEHHGHWACGWVDGFAIRVYDDSGEITDAFKCYCDLQAALEDYPVLDDELLSELENEEIDESWDCWISRDFERGLERKFDRDDFDIPSDKLRELFDKVCGDHADYPYHTGSEVICDVDKVVSFVTEDMVREFVPVVPVRIFCDGYVLVDGQLHLDEYTCDMSLYGDEFAACMDADDRGEESVTIDGKVYTWSIG